MRCECCPLCSCDPGPVVTVVQPVAANNYFLRSNSHQEPELEEEEDPAALFTEIFYC